MLVDYINEPVYESILIKANLLVKVLHKTI